MEMGWFCRSTGQSSGAGDVAGVSVKYGRSKNAIDDGVDTDDGADETGSELRVPASDPSGIGQNIVVAVLFVKQPREFHGCC